MMLVPGADLLNHAQIRRDQAAASLQYNLARSTLYLESFVAYDRGAEVYNCYGLKPNAQLLVQYGFVLPVNPQDAVPLPLRFIPRSPHEHLTDRVLQAMGLIMPLTVGVLFATAAPSNTDIAVQCSARDFKGHPCSSPFGMRVVNWTKNQPVVGAFVSFGHECRSY